MELIVFFAGLLFAGTLMLIMFISVWILKIIFFILLLIEAINIFKNIKFSVKIKNPGKLIFVNYISAIIVFIDLIFSYPSKFLLEAIAQNKFKNYELIITMNNYINYIMLFLLFFMTIRLFLVESKNEKEKNPYLFFKIDKNKNWKIKDTDIIKRFQFLKEMRFLSSEKNELIEINSNKNPQQIFAQNIEQAFHILTIKYGKYEESWNIKKCKVNDNIIEFHIVLENNKEKMIKIEKYIKQLKF